jgi:hypothetical protein
MTLKTIAFAPHNLQHLQIFKQIGRRLRARQGFRVIYIRELGNIKGESVFEFDRSISNRWNSLDISYANLASLDERYTKSDLTRALFCERNNNYYPKYFKHAKVAYKTQLKYLVGCIEVFDEWLTANPVDCIVSELLIGVADSVLSAVCREKNVQYLSIRSSKLLPGVITCSPEIDRPLGMIPVYKDFMDRGVPDRYFQLAKLHIEELRSGISTPDYMQVSKTNFKLMTRQRLLNYISAFGKNRIFTNDISLCRRPLWESILRILHRFVNIQITRMHSSRWFYDKLPRDEKYFLFPLQYEPEATTLIRAYPFSDQMSVIQQIAKALPLGTTLVVKEHRGNHGYRKPSFYRDLHYLPNVKLVPREAILDGLIKNSLGVITLNSRMGWEALVLGRPVIALGKGFWTSFDKVKNPASWAELRMIIRDIVSDGGRDLQPGYDDRLIAYAAAYISLTKRGNFVLASEDFLTPANIEKLADIVAGGISR